MSKLTVTLPDDLHAQIRQELEAQGITTGQFIEMVVTKYFTKSKEGENNMATRTIAFQVQVGLSLQSHDPSQRSQGFLTLAGGIIITFAKEILDLIIGTGA